MRWAGLGLRPGEDACNGAVSLYGLDTSPAREDVGVVHWKHLGASGEYSTHTRTRVYSDVGVELTSRTNGNGEPEYEVDPGQTVQMEVTLENNGATTQSPLTKFYWSGNDLITTVDTELSTRTPTIGRNDVYVITHTVVIPITATSGQTDYLGVIIDADDSIDEVNEQNNATYIGVYIK